jgi:hypothetical protein
LCKIFEFFISCCNNNLLFPGKEAKSVVPLRGRLVSPELGEADHGGLPPRNGQRLSPSASLNSLFFVIIIIFFFQKKKQKALFRFAEG